MIKNTASQKIAVFAWNNATGIPAVDDEGQITAQVSIDGAATAATNDANPDQLDSTDAPGVYLFNMTKAETNGNLILLSAVSATADIDIQPVFVYTRTLALEDVMATQMTESYAADGVAPTPAQALFMIQQLLSEFVIAAGTYTIYKLDGTTPAATLTLNDATNPTGATRET